MEEENTTKPTPVKFSTLKHLYVPFFFPELNSSKDYSKRPKLIVIDGLIGAGKTTFIDLFVEYLRSNSKKVAIIKEPVDEWVKSGLLQKFYEDRKRWGYTFQTTAFRSRIMMSIKMYHKHAHEVDYFVTERCVFSDSIFMNMLVEDGFVTEMEQIEYHKWWNLWYMLMPAVPDIFIWLRPDVEVCMERIKSRGRAGEENIELQYQQRLHEGYSKIMGSDKVIIDEYVVPCCHLNTNDNFRDDPEVQKKLLTQVDNMLKKL